MSYPLSPQISAQLARLDLDALFPPFRELYVECIIACAARGFFYWGISGLRDDADQEALYGKGRKKQPDGSWIVTDASKIVTKAQPGSSDHNYGIGADSALDREAERGGLQPGWAISDYQVLAEEAKRLGLNALYYSTIFPEGPHVGLDLKRYGITHHALRSLKEKGGMAAVWEYLDGHDWTAP